MSPSVAFMVGDCVAPSRHTRQLMDFTSFRHPASSTSIEQIIYYIMIERFKLGHNVDMEPAVLTPRQDQTSLSAQLY